MGMKMANIIGEKALVSRLLADQVKPTHTSTLTYNARRRPRSTPCRRTRSSGLPWGPRTSTLPDRRQRPAHLQLPLRHHRHRHRWEQQWHLCSVRLLLVDEHEAFFIGVVQVDGIINRISSGQITANSGNESRRSGAADAAVVAGSRRSRRSSGRRSGDARAAYAAGTLAQQAQRCINAADAACAARAPRAADPAHRQTQHAQLTKLQTILPWGGLSGPPSLAGCSVSGCFNESLR